MDTKSHAGEGCALSPAQAEAIEHVVQGIWKIALAFAGPAAQCGGYYTSCELPPGMRRRATYHAHVKHIASAVKVGRTWVIRREDWHAAMAESRPTPTTKKDTDSVESILAAKGVRLRGGRAA